MESEFCDMSLTSLGNQVLLLLWNPCALFIFSPWDLSPFYDKPASIEKLFLWRSIPSSPPSSF